jgi:hypothetical protein
VSPRAFEGEHAPAGVLVREQVALDLGEPLPNRGPRERTRAAQHPDHLVEQPPHRVRIADHVALVLERRARHLPALPALADDPVRGRARTVEEHLVEQRAAGHLAQRADRDAGLVHVEQQVGDARVLGRVGLGAEQAEHVVRLVRTRGPDLVAVDHPLVADELGARRERREVAARARLAVALAPDVLAGERAAR